LLQVDVSQLIPSLCKMSSTYGPIFTIHLGSRPCVVLSGFSVLKETLMDRAEEFSGRGDFPAVQQWSHGNGETHTHPP
ncbi:CP2F2 protein, partial [Podargus strigoides]|nr:CP2F2 protein [Podargus strigoides]